MVEPITLTTAAVALLAPYLTKAGEGAASKAGEAAWAKLSELYQVIRRKFDDDGDADAKQKLRRLENQPEDEERQAALASVLREKAQSDPDFAQELDRVTTDATQTQGIDNILTQVYGNAKVGKIANFGQARDVSF